MECILYKIQYIWKPKTLFNLRLNNHRKDASNPKAIPTCNHIKIRGHIFIKHAKFTLIEQLYEQLNFSKDTLRLIKLKTVAPKALNQELNNVESLIGAILVHLILIYCS